MSDRVPSGPSSNGCGSPLVVPLGHVAAADVAVGGAKGAGLARAMAAGLPVPDGFVIAPAASGPALAEAGAAMERRGSGGARMAIIGKEFDRALVEAVAAAASSLPEPLIVRSSSVLEGGGEWSGAFTSVPEVRRDEIPKATKSVWASCFTLEALERFEAAGIEPQDTPMGVVVQPEIAPDFGGAALAFADGSVRIDAVRGSPRDLMAGWASGSRAEVSGGEVSGRDALDLMGEPSLRAVSELALRAHDELGFNLIEWLVVDDRPVLLQVQRSRVASAESGFEVPAALGHPFALDFVRLARQYPGAWGEELALGWLPGVGGSVEPLDPPAGASIDELVEQGRRLARLLTAEAWAVPADEAVARAKLVLRRMRSDRPNESVEALRALNPVDEDRAAELLGIARRLIEATRPAGRQGLDRWEPVLAGVAALQGEAFVGRPSAGGIGAGRLVWVESSKQTDHVRPRDIIVTQYPLANFSPLLFDASGIVSLGGAPTAHLFEVARSLTVPAVVDCPVGDIVRRGPCLGMLDGDAGRVAILRHLDG